MLVLVPGTLAQSDWYVDGACGNDAWNGSSPVCAAPNGPKRTIQAGLDAATGGDTVRVADGIYTGTGNKYLYFSGQPIALRSLGGPSACVIDCEDSGPAFWFVADEPPGTLVDGFRITRGNSSSGGAVFCHHAARPTFVDCVFADNQASTGGAVHCDTTSMPSFLRCSFLDNHAQAGGALYFWTEGLNLGTVEGCVLSGNVADFDGGAIFAAGPTPRFVNCALTANTAGRDGGAAHAEAADLTFVNCTFAANVAAGRGGALDVRGASVEASLANCVLWSNTAALGPELALITVPGYGGGRLRVERTDVQGGQAGAYVEPGALLTWGPGNLDTDPLFANAPAGDRRLTAGSPCIDAGGNALVPAGITTDLDLHPRFVDDLGAPDTGAGAAPLVDMGAWERGSAVQIYCTAKVNSQGCVPSIGASGIASTSGASPFLVTTQDVINNKSGILFYGTNGPQAAPFQGGFLCAAPPRRRTPLQFSAGNPPPDDCSGSYSFDFNARIQSGQDPALVPGGIVNAQYWSRDPQSPIPTGLTDAVEFAIAP